MIYLIHFDKPFHHAKHYTGFCESGNLDKRMLRHGKGNGSKLMRAVAASGIDWSIAKVWPDGTRDQERKLKNRGGASKRCPICIAAKKEAAKRRALISINYVFSNIG